MTNLYLIIALKHKSSDATSGIIIIVLFDCCCFAFYCESLQTELSHRYVYKGECSVYT